MTAEEYATKHGDTKWTTADCETSQNLAQIDQREHDQQTGQDSTPPRTH